MKAEGTPPAPSSHTLPFARLLAGVARVALRFPIATLSIALGLAAAAIVLSSARLGYKSSRLDLLYTHSDYNRLWIEYIDEFGNEDDAVIVVEGESRDQVVPVLEELSTLLARERHLFHAVLHEVDLSKIRGKGLHYAEPQELQEIESFLAGSLAIARGQWARLKIGAMVEGLAAQIRMQPDRGASQQGAAADATRSAANGSAAAAQPSPTVLQLQRLTESLLVSLNEQGRRYQSPWPGMPSSLATISELSSEYLLAEEGKLGFVLLRLAGGNEGLAPSSTAIDALRRLIDDLRLRHPDTTIGLTGLPVMENDEMRASQWSMTWASIVSLGGVVLVVIAGFGGVRHALLANGVLLIGMAWSFGYVTLSIGHLNILSVTFTVTLIGIGIDFGTYYVARYMQLRRQRLPCAEAVVETSRAVGPSISTGALTIAVAFFAAGLTSFTGVSELGVIAGGGILLCAVAQLVVLPACIYLSDRGRTSDRIPDPVPVHRLIAPLMRVPRLVVAAGIGVSIFCATGLPRLWYDHNLLNMQPIGLESVELERKLLTESDQSVWYAISIADTREELLKRKARFDALESVERTQEIVSLLPLDHDEKRPIIERIDRALHDLPERPPLIAVDPLEELGPALARAQDIVATAPGGRAAARNLEQIRNALRGMQPADCYAELSQFQQCMAGDLLSRLHALSGIANPEPPQLADLPSSLVDRFVGHNGKHLLKIYGRGDIWNMESLKQFVTDVRSVDRRVTGNPLQAYEASTEMKHSYELAALYALIVICVVLWIDFRNPSHVLLATFPLALSMVQTFGLMGLFNIPLNPANLIALPLIVGIGVDYGVHIVHNFLEQQGRYKIAPATAIAVAVDALTTIIGFGSLMIASHQGLQSLGRVLTLGISCCMVTSLVILPALLTWVTRNRAETADDEPDDFSDYDEEEDEVVLIGGGDAWPGRVA
jgi:hopanoid biosynthesis associated RND transporter like protein HpnN